MKNLELRGLTVEAGRLAGSSVSLTSSGWGLVFNSSTSLERPMRVVSVASVRSALASELDQQIFQIALRQLKEAEPRRRGGPKKGP